MQKRFTNKMGYGYDVVTPSGERLYRRYERLVPRPPPPPILPFLIGLTIGIAVGLYLFAVLARHA